jgi:membrane protease YdiL (CAAX protease family)
LEAPLVKSDHAYRTLSWLAVLALMGLATWMLIFQPTARGGPLVSGVVLLLAWAGLRLGAGHPANYWSAATCPKQVGPVSGMIIATSGALALAGIALDLLGRLTPTSAAVTALLIWTLVPAAFLCLGLVKWPERRGSPSMRELVVVGGVAISLAAVFSFAVVSVGADRPEFPSMGGLAVTLSGVLIAATAEEVVFRVLLLTALVASTRSRMDALILSAVAFGLVHAPLALLQPVLRADWAMLSYAATAYAPLFLMQTALGLLFGALWLRTGSITVIAVTHALINLGNAMVQGL